MSEERWDQVIRFIGHAEPELDRHAKLHEHHFRAERELIDLKHEVQFLKARALGIAGMVRFITSSVITAAIQMAQWYWQK